VRPVPGYDHLLRLIEGYAVGQSLTQRIIPKVLWP
jgi:hypothetical protein